MIKTTQWIISKFDSATDIMVSDSKAMKSLEDRLYSKVYKGEKKIVVVRITDKTIVGYANSSSIPKHST
jgi:hypothetical protein